MVQFLFIRYLNILLSLNHNLELRSSSLTLGRMHAKCILHSLNHDLAYGSVLQLHDIQSSLKSRSLLTVDVVSILYLHLRTIIHRYGVDARQVLLLYEEEVFPLVSCLILGEGVLWYRQSAIPLIDIIQRIRATCRRVGGKANQLR